MSGIMWANDDDSGGSVPFPFPMAQEDEEEEEDTRSPLPPNTNTSTAAAAAAAATETNPARAPTLASGSAPVEEIGEATFTLLEAAAYAVPFPDFCDRLEATGRAKGAMGKVEAFFFAGCFRAWLEVHFCVRLFVYTYVYRARRDTLTQTVEAPSVCAPTPT